ncbi:MAG: Gfo/Idh/MocA family oxidoreductase [Longimicrobiales bacterium]
MTRARDVPLRVGLIGYGLAGAVFHAPLIAATRGLRLTAIVTRDPVRAAGARKQHPSVRVVDSADRLWEQAAGLDVVVIAAPNRAHLPLALAALAAGLPVVVDKPLAPSADEARQLIGEAQGRRLLLTVFHNRRWDGDFLTLQRLLAEGELGDVLRFESRFERWRPTPKPGWRERGDPHEAGGLLYDLGSHLIDQALVLFGPVTQVYAELDRRRADVAVEDDAFVALTHASGPRSHLWMSAVAAQLGPRMRVLGSHAAWTKFGLDVQEAALRAGVTVGDARWGEEEAQLWGAIGTVDDVRPVRTEPGDYRRFYAGLLSALRDGVPPPVDPADAVAGLEIIEAARRSAAEGRTIALSPRGAHAPATSQA